VKLFAAGGAWVGWAGLPSVLLLAALIGLAAALAGGRTLSAVSKLPFGPALALAIWIVWLYGPLMPVMP
jgi:leader peptidase (prepilin peptidase) / N-methyltransferase